jgi:hypothetical protein
MFMRVHSQQISAPTGAGWSEADTAFACPRYRTLPQRTVEKKLVVNDELNGFPVIDESGAWNGDSGSVEPLSARSR